MRDLGTKENSLKLRDTVSDSELELYYRMPTTSEIQSYQNKLYVRKRNKLVMKIFETRLDFGSRILTGFREGDFGIDGKIISSNPSSENYREDWKSLLQERAATIITTLATVVFEGIRVSGEEEFEIVNEEETEDIPPFPKSSEN